MITTNQSFSNSRNLLIYLSVFKILDYFDLNDRNEVQILCRDYCEYAGVNYSVEQFHKDLQYAARIINQPRFSFFMRPISNIFPTKEINLIDVFNFIKEPKFYANETAKLRAITDKTEAKRYKAANFDYVTFSGIFSRRLENNLTQHSNLIVLDFDNVSDIFETKKNLLSDTRLETQLLFISPSGTGLKWIVSINTGKYSHSTYFSGIQNYLYSTYKLKVDVSGKDDCRACFLCHDPEVFIHPKYLI